jgi:hypothetical protein
VGNGFPARLAWQGHQPAFRPFVEDMRKRLTRRLNPGSPWQTTGRLCLSRRDLLPILTARIENVAPRADQRTRGRLDSRGLVLWATRWGILSDLAGDVIEPARRRWPVSLRRRFISARYSRIRKRWPYSPYGTTFGGRIDGGEIAAIDRLPDAPSPDSNGVARSDGNISVTHPLEIPGIWSAI